MNAPTPLHVLTQAMQQGQDISTIFADNTESLYQLVQKLDAKVTDADMPYVHHLTYPLDTALKKINDEMAGLAVTLEAVHQASEKLDRAAVLKHGRAYLSVADEVVK